MRRLHYIAIVLSIVLFGAQVGPAQTSLQDQVDSLFMIASEGRIQYQDQVEPAKDSLAALGADVAPLLIDKLDTKSARERLTIIQVFKKIGSDAVPALVRALRRTDGLIVQRVCWALGDIKDSTAVQPLVDVSGHERWQVRDQAIGALGKIGDRSATPTVVAALNDSIGQVRKSAAVSIGRMTVDSAIPQLVHTLGDEFYGARMSAFESLLALDSAWVERVVIDSLDSDNRLVGNLGCAVLGQIGTDVAIEHLLYQNRNADPERRAFAGVALVDADPMDNCGYHRFLLLEETDRFVILKVQSAMVSSNHGK